MRGFFIATLLGLEEAQAGGLGQDVGDGGDRRRGMGWLAGEENVRCWIGRGEKMVGGRR